ncbi:MAG: helix-turn-helix domain-containing protein [Polaromonas sp.]|nr:helix-turn-helix domain-containing protein [Polaromonas sp.]
MQFKTFFFRLNKQERKDFSEKVGTSSGHLTNFSYGYTTLAPILCSAIERETNGEVSRRDLRPDDCEAIWPDLLNVVA